MRQAPRESRSGTPRCKRARAVPQNSALLGEHRRKNSRTQAPAWVRTVLKAPPPLMVRRNMSSAGRACSSFGSQAEPGNQSRCSSRSVRNSVFPGSGNMERIARSALPPASPRENGFNSDLRTSEEDGRRPERACAVPAEGYVTARNSPIKRRHRLLATGLTLIRGPHQTVVRGTN